MLFMGHTCLKNQTRATELTLRVDSPFALRAQTLFSASFPPFFRFRRFPAERRIPLSLSPSLLSLTLSLTFPSSAPEATYPSAPPFSGQLLLRALRSREFYKTFHASLIPLPFPLPTDETTNTRMD